RGALIVTDGVFSMDGDTAPLQRIVELAHRYDARVMVDDAHGLGALGPGGRGSVADAGLEDEVDIVVGTLGKALGSYGAYACMSRTMSKYLINTARTLIFSTALSPPAVAAAGAALDLLIGDPRRVDRLQRNAKIMREALAAEGMATGDSTTQVLPLVESPVAIPSAASASRMIRAFRCRRSTLRGSSISRSRAAPAAATAGGDSAVEKMSVRAVLIRYFDIVRLMQ